MTIPERKPKYMTGEEFLQFVQQTGERYEFFDGVAVAMTGVSKRHNLLTNSLYKILDSALAGSKCRIYSSDIMVQIKAANSYYLPDIVVSCADSDSDLDDPLIRSPILVVEVLSPSTAATDRREKWRSYSEIESLREYLLVYQTMKRIEVFRKTKSGRFFAPETVESGSFLLNSIANGLSVNIEQIYKDCGLASTDDTPPEVREATGVYAW
jgi:Uma2 family endonuclease